MEPKIRIEGKDNWKIKTLSDISKKVVTKNTALKYDVTLTNSAEFGIISQLDFFDHKISNDKSISNYFIVEPDDFVYNPRVSVLAPVGPINRNLLGFPGVMSPLYYVFKVHDVDKEFLDYYFHTRLWHKFMYDKGNCGARFDRLSISDSEFVKMPIYIPESKIEQGSVASFFRNFDNLISTTKSRISSLRQMRVASLQAMFPQKCATKPQIRFKGFEDEWKIKKLCEISYKVITKNSQLKYQITLTNSAEHGIINQLDFFNHEISNGDNIIGYYVVENDDFVYNPRISVSAPVGPINRNLLGYTGVMSPLYYVFKVHDVDKDYLSHYFKTNLWHKYMQDNGNSGARHDRISITDDVFGQLPILMPKEKEEQIEIAKFFTALDKQISLEEQKLESLKRIKSACLDKMFV